MSVTWQKSTHGVPKKRGRSDRSLGLTLIAISLVIALIAGVYLLIVNANMKLTTRLWEQHIELNEIRNKNVELRADIARASSIFSLIERSRALGYEPAVSVEFIQEP